MTQPTPARDIVPDNAHALLSVAQMGAADQAAIAAGIPGIDLMENAGRAVADAIVNRFAVGRTIVLCGPGNNGGDGYVVAHLLAARGWPVSVIALVPPAQLKGDAALAAQKWSGPVTAITDDALAGADLIVDALFGAGLARPLEGYAKALIERANASGVPIVAIDVPSGVLGDSGAVVGAAPRCALTVTFFRAKPGHLLLPGRDYCGETLIADIGIGASVLDGIDVVCWANAPGHWRQAVPAPQLGDHKYGRGHALIIGGASMTGAARLAALAARRIGVGMLSIAAPPQAAAIYRAAEPGNIVVELNDVGALAEMVRTRRVSAMLVGPGLGLGPATKALTLAALKASLPLVLDADALSAFAEAPTKLLEAIGGPTVLTPHDGEFARLFPGLDGNRLSRARAAAQRSRAVVLLKGADTVIAAPDGRALINNNAPPWLATAGSGDVLAGLIVGLLAQGMAPFAAASAAAWLHGEAGNRIGRGLIAEDLPAQCAQALVRLQ